MQADAIKANLLIVDDTPENLHILSRVLMYEGYKVRVAVDGSYALDAVRASPPDLILLDIMMPGLDGYETCIQLKADPYTCGIPVIFLSALDEIFDKVKAFEVGGVDYVTKPFHPEEVLARVKTHLALRQLQLKLEQRNAELEEALATIKTLKGLIPICAWCGRKIKDGEVWVEVETYVKTHADVEFTHGICPDCMSKEFTKL
jgi:DNA-binding response OmpR family regulator